MARVLVLGHYMDRPLILEVVHLDLLVHLNTHLHPLGLELDQVGLSTFL